MHTEVWLDSALVFLVLLWSVICSNLDEFTYRAPCSCGIGIFGLEQQGDQPKALQVLLQYPAKGLSLQQTSID